MLQSNLPFGIMVRATRLWCRKLPEGREFKLGLRCQANGTPCQPSRKMGRLPVSNKGRLILRKERGGLRIPYSVPKTQRASTPSAPTTIRLWDTFTGLKMIYMYIYYPDENSCQLLRSRTMVSKSTLFNQSRPQYFLFSFTFQLL